MCTILQTMASFVKAVGVSLIEWAMVEVKLIENCNIMDLHSTKMEQIYVTTKGDRYVTNKERR